MDVYKSLPFLQHTDADLRLAGRPRSYARGYGNRVASGDAFPPLRGMPPRQGHPAVAAPPVPALAACGCR